MVERTPQGHQAAACSEPLLSAVGNTLLVEHLGELSPLLNVTEHNEIGSSH